MFYFIIVSGTYLIWKYRVCLVLFIMLFYRARQIWHGCWIPCVMKTVVTMVIYLMSVQDQVSIHPGPCKLYQFIMRLFVFFLVGGMYFYSRIEETLMIHISSEWQQIFFYFFSKYQCLSVWNKFMKINHATVIIAITITMKTTKYLQITIIHTNSSGK